MAVNPEEKTHITGMWKYTAYKNIWVQKK
jgi:hypothetical protein